MAVKTVKAVINGTTHTLTLNQSTGLYEATITAPSKSSFNQTGGYYPISIIAQDSAGNTTEVDDTDSTLGNNLKLYVKETTAPVISITSPTEGQIKTEKSPKIEWTITDNDSGVNSNTISITINNGTPIKTGITKTAISNGYKCAYTIASTSADGTYNIKINGSDNDGNAAVQKTVNFVLDTTPPVLNVTSPANGLVTKNTSIAVSGSASDNVSSSVTVKIRVNEGVAQSISVGTGQTFNHSVTLSSGMNTITITATDGAGKSSTVTRTVVVDPNPPVIRSVVITPNPANTGKQITISVEVTDD